MNPYREPAEMPTLEEWCEDEVPDGPWRGVDIEVQESCTRRTRRREQGYAAALVAADADRVDPSSIGIPAVVYAFAFFVAWWLCARWM